MPKLATLFSSLRLITQRGLCSLILLSAYIAAAHSNDLDLDFDLDSLLNANVQVTSAMKRPQSLESTASSLYVLTAEQIINSGAVKIPDILRLVPGMQVRQVNKNQYAVGIRFAGSAFVSKLLVMVDGHNVYHPAVSTTYWEMMDIAPEDIERIEVIRGQTGNLWGFNAINGVINIITKQNIDHLDPSLAVNLATDASIDINGSKGGRINDALSYRLYGSQRAASDSAESSLPGDADDNSNLTSLGLRFDLNASDQSFLTSRLDYAKGSFGQLSEVAQLDTGRNEPTRETINRESWRWSSRFTHRLNDRSEQILQVNATKFTGSQMLTEEDHELVDVDYQLNTSISDHQLDFGLNYRVNNINVANDIQTFDLGNTNTFKSIAGFMQLQLNVIPDKLSFILGNLTTHDNYIGTENQPTGRILFNMNERNTYWLSLSQAARSPSYFEYDLRSRIGGASLNDFGSVNNTLLDGFAIPTFLEGSDQAQAERAFSRELGYRYKGERFSVDMALFAVKTDNILAYEFDNTNIDPQTIAVLIAQRDIAGLLQLLETTEINAKLKPGVSLDTKGGEISVFWQPTNKFNGELAYSIFDMSYGNRNSRTEAISRDSVLRQWMLKGQYRLSNTQQLFVMLKTESGASYNTGRISSSLLSWSQQLNDKQTFSIYLRNGLDGSQLEFFNEDETPVAASYSNTSIGFNWLTHF